MIRLKKTQSGGVKVIIALYSLCIDSTQTLKNMSFYNNLLILPKQSNIIMERYQQCKSLHNVIISNIIIWYKLAYQQHFP